jgi:DNA invertase Pin-like site-specific DNA recombinase
MDMKAVDLGYTANGRELPIQHGSSGGLVGRFPTWINDPIQREGKRMAGERFGYVRVSSLDQNPERQLDGVQVDRMFLDRASGKDTARPQFEDLLTYARTGDIVVVHSMDRLARNLSDLLWLVQDFTSRGVKIEFMKEGLTFSGDDSPVAMMILSVIGAIAEFERSLIRERQREGIAKAKERGMYKGRQPSLTPEQVALVQEMAVAQTSVAKLARKFGVYRSTIYSILKAERPTPRPSSKPLRKPFVPDVVMEISVDGPQIYKRRRQYSSYSPVRLGTDLGAWHFAGQPENGATPMILQMVHQLRHRPQEALRLSVASRAPGKGPVRRECIATYFKSIGRYIRWRATLPRAAPGVQGNLSFILLPRSPPLRVVFHRG